MTDSLIPLNKTSSFSKKQYFLYPNDTTRILVDFSQCNDESYEVFYKVNPLANQLNECQKFTSICEYLEKNIGGVPHIYSSTDSQIIMQNLGSNSLLSLALTTAKFGVLQQNLHRAVDWLTKLNQLYFKNVCHKNVINHRKYCRQDMLKESQCFIKHGLSSFQEEEDLIYVNKVFSKLVDHIYDSQPFCYIHRDFQSANIIIYDTEIYAIDLQDASLGPVLYDLASLLYDLKISLPEVERNTLSSYYFKVMEAYLDLSLKEFNLQLAVTGFLRLIKSLTLRLKHHMAVETKKGYELYLVLKHKLVESSLVEPRFFQLIEARIPALEPTGLEVIILGAGQGKRMGGNIPKVLQPCLGIPMLDYVVRNATMLGPDHIHLVVGYKKEMIKQHLENLGSCYHLVEQRERLGTGHAVMQVTPFLKSGNTVLVMAGDVPVLDYQTLRKFVERFNEGEYPAGILTANTPTPDGYGRIIKDDSGKFIGTIEQKDIPEDRDDLKAINEISTGTMIFQADQLTEKLKLIKNDNAQSEYYLPSVINLLIKENHEVMTYLGSRVPEIHGANNPKQLIQIEEWMHTHDFLTIR